MRRIAAAVLLFFIGAEVIGDLVIPTYRLDSVVLGLLLGALLVLLGVEVGQRLLR